MQTEKNSVRQAGMTLIEIITSLSIIAAVVVGALSLYNSAQSSNSGTQLVKDITSLESATKSLFLGQTDYGAASLNNVLIRANKVPTTLAVTGSTINTPIGGTLTVTGATRSFTINVTAVPRDVCITLLTNLSTGWSGVKIGTADAITTFPITPSIASGDTGCAAGANTITWTSIN